MLRPAFLPLAALVGSAFWLSRVAQGGRAWRTPGDFPILALLLTAALGLAISPQPAETRVQAWRLLNGMALYSTLAAWAGVRSRLRWAAAGLAAVSAALACYALIGVTWTDAGVPAAVRRLYGLLPVLVSDTANPNVMAGALAYLLPAPLALALFIQGRGRQEPGTRVSWQAALFGLAGLWSAVVLALTLSRGAILAIVAAILALVALRWRRGWLLLPAIFVVGLAVSLWLGPDRVLGEVIASATLGGSEGRGEVWTRALYILEDFPLTGAGLGSFTRVTDLLYPLFRYPPGTIGHAHNLFLQVGVDLGLPGLAAWLGLYLLALVLSWRVYRVGNLNGDSWAAGLGAGLFAGQIALGVHGLVDAVTWGMVRPAPLVWGVWGVIMAAARLLLVDDPLASGAAEAGAPQ
jgi:putative inorganic carbon (HCO3(-)) transporter